MFITSLWDRWLLLPPFYIRGKCVSHLLLCGKLPKLPSFRHITSQFRGSEIWAWLMVSYRAAVKVSASSKDSSEDLTGEGSASKLIYVVIGFSSLRAVGLWTSLLCWVLAGCHPQLLATWASPTCQLSSSKPERESVFQQDESHGSDIPSSLLLLVSSKLHKRMGLYNMWRTGSGNHGGWF